MKREDKKFLVHSKVISGIENFIFQYAYDHGNPIDVGELEKASIERFGYRIFEVMVPPFASQFKQWKKEFGVYEIIDGKINYNG